MPPPRFVRPKLNGAVTVRRFQPPQLETEAQISKGELTESLEAVALRVGLRQSSDGGIQTTELCLVDGQELALMSKLVDKGVYYVSGGVALLAPQVNLKADNVTSSVEIIAPSTALFPPDCAVLWAFDPRMLLHRPLNNRSQETPSRLQRAVEALQQCERAADILPVELLRPLASSMDGSMHPSLEPKLTNVSGINCARWIPPRFATPDEIYSFQNPKVYREFVEKGVPLASSKNDVYCNEDTSSAAARLSVGAVVDASVSVLRNVAEVRCKRSSTLADTPLLAYCLVRPPGHHCTCSAPSGFCLVNNVAIAATQLREQCKTTLSSGVPRVAILDLDVHFGEGTASFVEDIGDPQTLLYLSIHRYDKQKFYPYDRRGDTAYVGGEGGALRARGCICNVAVHTDANNPSLCEHVISDQLLHQTLEGIFLPRLELFQPDIVLVSLGFDAAYNDPLGKMAVECGFAGVIARLKQWCLHGGRATGLVVVLEGGYDPEAVAQGVVSVGLALTLPLTDPAVQAASRECTPRVWANLRQRQERQLRGWQQLQKEREEEKKESAARDTARAVEAGGDVVDAHGGTRPPEQVVDDATLLERHKRWCSALVAKVNLIHRNALHLEP